MNAASICSPHAAQSFVLRYESLRQADRILFFPCDAKGRVRIDALSRRDLNDYLFARAVVGFEFAAPRVQCGSPH